MPQQDPDLPESIILSQFGGIKNTVAPERLAASDLESAINIDIDDAGQVRRRRGYAKVDLGAWHSLTNVGDRIFGVREGSLTRLNEDYSYVSLQGIGNAATCFTAVGNEVFFASVAGNGVIQPDDTVIPWGTADGQPMWVSPVINPTETLGKVRGQNYSPPPAATSIEAYKGRIYLAQGKTLWATELYRYHYVEKTKGFMQFEHIITAVRAVDDGLYVGTEGGLYFLQGVLGKFRLSQIISAGVLRGSDVMVPTDKVHPNARNSPMPTGEAVVLMSDAGIIACFDGGQTYNLTHDRVIFPSAVSAAALFRQDLGANSYIVAADSAGGPAANTRIGDWVDAEIVRFGG